jgi:O-antigen/teichoic acid export membrane protein
LNIRAFSAYILARACPALGMLLIALITERKFGAQTYGEFSIAFSLSLAAAACAFGWISQAVSRFSNSADNLLESQPNVFWHGWRKSCCVVLSIALVASLVRADEGVIFLCGVIASLQGLHMVVVAMYQARLNTRVYFALESSRAVLLTSGCVALGFLLNKNVIGLLIGLAVGLSLNAALLVFYIRASGLLRRASRSSIETSRRIFSYGWPISIWLALSLAMPFIDRNVLKFMSGGLTMGRYSYEYDLVFRAFTFVLLPVTTSLQPFIFRAYGERSMQRVLRLVRTGLLAQISLAGAASVGLYAIAFDVLPLFAINLRITAGAYWMLCLGALSWQMALLCHKILECEKGIVTMVRLLVVSYFLVGVPSSILLFHIWGLVGFTAASSLGGFTYCVLAYGAGNRSIKSKNDKKFRG